MAHPTRPAGRLRLGRIGRIRVTGIATHLLPQMGKLCTIAIEFGSNARESPNAAPASVPFQETITSCSVLTVGALHPLMPFLRLDAEGSNRAGFQATNADRFVSLLAISVSAVVYPVERGIDLGDQLPFPRPGTQLDRPLRLKGSPVGEIGFEQTLLF